MKDQVAVIGVGCTKFGDRFERSYEELITDAAFDAYADAGIEPSEIDAAYLGTYLPGAGGGRAGGSLGAALRPYARPITRVENSCATGTDAFRNGCLAIAAGAYDMVLVLGAEKLKDRGGRGIPRLGHPLLARGNTAPGLFALAANRYMHTFGLGRETLARVAVKNHHNGALNDKAHLRMEVTAEQVLKAPIIAWPFGLFDCCPTTDGAAAAIICRADRARRYKKNPVLVKGVGLAVTTGRPYFDPTFDYLGFRSTQAAARQAYAMAGVGPRDIDLAEVHDCFTWTEISNTEDLGFCAKGEGGRLAPRFRHGDRRRGGGRGYRRAARAARGAACRVRRARHGGHRLRAGALLAPGAAPRARASARVRGDDGARVVGHLSAAPRRRRLCGRRAAVGRDRLGRRAAAGRHAGPLLRPPRRRGQRARRAARRARPERDPRPAAR